MKWQAMKYCKYFILILFDEGLVPGYKKNLCRVVIKKKKNQQQRIKRLLKATGRHLTKRRCKISQ